MTKTDTQSTVLLKHPLKALRLPTVLAECEKGAQRAAAENVDHLAFLLQGCALELIEREAVVVQGGAPSVGSNGQRRSFSTALTGRARMGSSRRKRWRSSANSRALP